MKITNQLSIATLVLAGVFATGCSQQSAGGSQSAGSSQVSGGSQQQVEGGSQVQNAGGSQQASSQQQVEAPAPVVTAPAPTAEPVVVPAPVIMEPKPQGNRWTHTHPAIPRCTKSIRHTHKYNTANHTHKYGCRAETKTKPEVDVEALQMKLKAKGYYKGPIDGVVGPATRSALQRFMQR